MNELALFAGAGGGILGGLLLGWSTVCAVELDPYARGVLLARQRDGMLGRFPIWDDVTTFDGRPWCGHVDVISGGFPCQDISDAGKRAGLTGARSGLWREFARIIREVRPRFVLVENSPALITRGIDTVLGDLAAMGMDARWGVLGAVDAGAPHERERIWIVACDPDGKRKSASDRCFRATESRKLPGISEAGRGGGSCRNRCEHAKSSGRARAGTWWDIPRFEGMDDGMAHRLERIKATGNGQVPAVVVLAWEMLSAPL